MSIDEESFLKKLFFLKLSTLGVIFSVTRLFCHQFVFYLAHYVICSEIVSWSLKYVGTKETWIYIRKLHGFGDTSMHFDALYEDCNWISGVIWVICPLFWSTTVPSRSISKFGTGSRGNLDDFCKMDAYVSKKIKHPSIKQNHPWIDSYSHN